MSIQRVVAAVIVTGTLATWVSFAWPVAAQETSTSSIASNPPVAAEKIQLPQSSADVLKLSRAKIGDDIIVAYVQNSRSRFGLTASEIVYLRNEGVSDRVLLAMLNEPQPAGTPDVAPQAVPQAAPLPAAAPQSAAGFATQPVETATATAPASTLYVVPATPAYYAFDGSWPWWYDSWWYRDPWPYVYTYSYWYPSYWHSYWTCGFYWGDWCYHHHHDGDRYCSNWDDGHHGGQGRPPGGHYGDGDRHGASMQAGRPASSWNNAGNRPASRTVASQASATISRGGQPGTTATWTRPANRTASTRPTAAQVAPQYARGNRSPAAATARSGQAVQRPASSATVNQSAFSAARARPAAGGPTTVWTRPATQPVARSFGNAGPVYQRSSSSGFSYRPAASAPVISRPAINSSFGGARSAATFRGSGGFSGARGPTFSSGGGGFRGAVGGGARMSSGGGGFRGGGGGRR